MALTTLQSIDAEIRQLEAQKKLLERRDIEVSKALAVLAKFSRVLTPAQRRKASQIIGDTVELAPAKAAKASKKGRKTGKVAPKYQLPTGETWAGRGLTPRAFSAWAMTAEGKAWQMANPGAKFPPAGPAAVKTPAKTTRKTAAKKAGTKKKAAKKVRKRTSGS